MISIITDHLLLVQSNLSACPTCALVQTSVSFSRWPPTEFCHRQNHLLAEIIYLILLLAFRYISSLSLISIYAKEVLLVDFIRWYAYNGAYY